MKQLRLFKTMLLMCLLLSGISNAWGEVKSGVEYSLTSPTTPDGWTITADFKGTSTGYYLLYKDKYIKTDEFTQGGFSNIKIKARTYGGPSEAQATITVSWFESQSLTETIIGTVIPTSTNFEEYNITNITNPTPNTTGYIKIECKGATATTKCAGISAVTLNFNSGGEVPPATVTAPMFDKQEGAYSTAITVKVNNYNYKYSYVYTIDGSKPDSDNVGGGDYSSTYYDHESGIEISSSCTLKMIAYYETYESSVTSATYTINVQQPYTVTFSVNEQTSNITEDSAGSGVVPPSVNPVGDYSFDNWSETDWPEEKTTHPNYVTLSAGKYYPNQNKTLYAIYKRTDSTSGSSTSTTQTATSTNLSAKQEAQVLEEGKPITYVMSNANSYSNPLRVYKGNTLTIAGATITKIVFTGSNTSNPVTNLVLPAGGSGNVSTGNNTVTWTGSATSVTFVASSAQARVDEISVTYTTDEPSSTTYYTSRPKEPIPTPDKTPASFAYTVHAKVGSQFQGLTFSNNLGAPATYSSDNTDVAEVDPSTGKVTIGEATGTAIITYTIAGTEAVNETSQSYTIIVE